MLLNKQLTELYGVTDEDYLAWCELNKKPSYLKKSKQEFYEYIRSLMKRG